MIQRSPAAFMETPRPYATVAGQRDTVLEQVDCICVLLDQWPVIRSDAARASIHLMWVSKHFHWLCEHFDLDLHANARICEQCGSPTPKADEPDAVSDDTKHTVRSAGIETEAQQGVRVNLEVMAALLRDNAIDDALLSRADTYRRRAMQCMERLCADIGLNTDPGWILCPACFTRIRRARLAEGAAP